MTNDQPAVPAEPASARHWTRQLGQYRQPSDGRAVFETAITFLPFVGLWLLMLLAYLEFGFWIALPLAVPAAAFLVRLFMIQHDCGHGSFFGNRHANDWAGRLIGVLTLTPYGFWRRTHAMHHAGSGNLDRRGFGDVHTLTVAEYRSAPAWHRLKYRLYRHPLVLFGIGPAYLFLVQHRLPVGLMGRGLQPWLSTMGTNLALVLIAGTLIWLVGMKAFLAVHLPIVLLGASIGVWLFYVQHQFEDTVWENGEECDWHEAALRGSSHYDLPPILRWLTANIGIHHVHHLASNIPFYRLSHVLRDHPQLRDISRITLWQSLGCVRLALWDETRRRLVTFGQAREMA